MRLILENGKGKGKSLLNVQYHHMWTMDAVSEPPLFETLVGSRHLAQLPWSAKAAPKRPEFVTAARVRFPPSLTTATSDSTVTVAANVEPVPSN